MAFMACKYKYWYVVRMLKERNSFYHNLTMTTTTVTQHHTTKSKIIIIHASNLSLTNRHEWCSFDEFLICLDHHQIHLLTLKVNIIDFQQNLEIKHGICAHATSTMEFRWQHCQISVAVGVYLLERERARRIWFTLRKIIFAYPKMQRGKC